jgi:hypothetical protein
MSDRGGAQVPAAPNRTPGFPDSWQPLIFEQFEGLNTKPLRSAIKPEEMSWCDGFMPLGPDNLRTLYGVSAPFYTVPAGNFIVWGIGANLGDTPYKVLLLADGSVQQIASATGVVTQIMPPGTIINPSSIMGFSQWATPTPMFVFTKDQTNGYWLWDGTNLFTAGGVSPEITITNAGKNYTSQPTITAATTGLGVGAAYRAVILNGAISAIICTAPGTGVGINDLIALTITGGGSDDSATATANISPPTVGGVDSVIVLAGGQGFTGATRIVATPVDGNGSGASFSFTAANGVITGVAVLNPGVGYTQPPLISASDPGFTGIPGGTGFGAAATIAGGQITGMTLVSGGTNYISPPDVTIIGDGTGAAAVAQLTNGQVTGFIMQTLGSGYTVALVLMSGGNNGASATTTIMPFGISGTTIEGFNNQIWDANGAAVAAFPPKNRVIFSDPASASDFDPSLGGGAFQSNNAALRVGYHCLKQANGFLYLIGDSSIDQISGVQTTATGTSSTTTFNIINVDPQVGTPWPSSVQVFNRDIIFANTLGIHICYGGAVTKISDPLDGFYYTGPIFGSSANFSSAVAQIFGRYVYMLLLPFIDPVTQTITTKLIMWDGKRFWTSPQEPALSYIFTEEINSTMTAWGTDGVNLFQLFARPSKTLIKTVQSKLWAAPGYDYEKMAMHLLGVVNYYGAILSLVVSIDNENGLGGGSAVIAVGGLIWTNNSGAVISWGPLVWGSGGGGLSAFGPLPVGQHGRFIGLTATTAAEDMALLSLMLVEQATAVMP